MHIQFFLDMKRILASDAKVETTSIDRWLAPFNPIGPIPRASLLLENKFQANQANILEKAEEYIRSISKVDEVNTHDFRAFFWSVDDAHRARMTQALRDLIPSVHEINYKNQAILTTLFHLFGIKGLIFAENLIISPLDPLAMDLSEPNSKEMFSDLVEIFRFLRKPQSGERYLGEGDPTLQDLASSIKQWQEMESRFKIRNFDGLKVIADGILRQEDLLVLYPGMVALLQLQMETIHEVMQENEQSKT